MNGLPGRLTVANIEAAKARGDDYIYYRHKNYSVKELESLVNKPRRSRGATSKPRQDKVGGDPTSEDRAGNVGERSGDGDEESAPVRSETVERSGKGSR